MSPAVSPTAVVRIAYLSERGDSINMDNEMKEPNGEQTHSASDEQIPNIEGKQFPDGADDAPSPENRPSNEYDVVCKKEESDSLLTNAIHKLGGKKRAAIAATAIAAVVFCLPTLFPQLFCTHKLWTNASCTSPRTCKSCGKTEGEPLGHEWEEATCTVPKTCQRCGKTDGKPLGHQPGSWTTEVDYADATSKEIRECKNAARSLTLATKRKLLPFLATDRFQFHLKALLNDLTRNSPISPIAAV